MKIPEEHTALIQRFPTKQIFLRLQVEGMLLHSKMYTRSTRRNNHTVEFVVGDESCVGFIEFYVEVEQSRYAVITQLIPIAPYNLAMPHYRDSQDHIFKFDPQG